MNLTSEQIGIIENLLATGEFCSLDQLLEDGLEIDPFSPEAGECRHAIRSFLTANSRYQELRPSFWGLRDQLPQPPRNLRLPTVREEGDASSLGSIGGVARHQRRRRTEPLHPPPQLSRYSPRGNPPTSTEEAIFSLGKGNLLHQDQLGRRRDHGMVSGFNFVRFGQISVPVRAWSFFALQPDLISPFCRE